MKNNTPELRFKEFTDEWQEKKLGDLADIQRGRFSPRPRNDPKYYGGDIPFVQTGDVVKSGGQIGNYTQTLNDEGIKVSKLFPRGTILITIAANIGYTGILQQSMACPDSLIGINCKNNSNNKFLNYSLSRERERMDRIASEAAQKNINIEFLRPYKLIIPAVQEQEKIAGFLMAVDEKINMLELKKKSFEKYKKGVMQAIFSQKARFKKPDGSNYPDWEEKELGSVLTKNSKKNKDKKIILVQSVSNTRGFVNQVDYFERIIASKDLGNYYIIEKGTFAYNPSRIDVGSLAYKYDDSISVISPLYISFRPKPESLNDGYLLSWFSSGEFLKQMNNMFEGSVRHTLNYDALKQMVINLPSPHEQEKIAEFLKSLDSKVGLINKQLEQTKLFKKSLLQKMFV